ncbi:MAG: PIG-L deacetylase family protein [Anaerolineales bacterium]
MKTQRHLMCVLAHPDDESMGTGGILAKYGSEGVETSVVTATGGEHGWFGDPSENPGAAALAELRRQELAAACNVLGVEHQISLGYEDGALDAQDPVELVRRIVTELRLRRPQVVVTFDPFGSYGHPDHIAISQATTSAVLVAADSTFGDHEPHAVQKLYYFVFTQSELAVFERIFGELAMEIDGTERRSVGWQPWAITTRIDTRRYARAVGQAISCHRSQLPGALPLDQLSTGDREVLWGESTLYRLMSQVNGGRTIERDLFEGIA